MHRMAYIKRIILSLAVAALLLSCNSGNDKVVEMLIPQPTKTIIKSIMSINDWQAGLQAFLDSNPDLPEGEDVKINAKKETTPQPRLDIILEKKGRGGKIATIVTGFLMNDNEVEQLASKIK